MPVSSTKRNKSPLASLIHVTQTHLYKQFPAHEHRLKVLLDTRFVTKPISDQIVHTPTYHFKPNLPEEEVISIVEKARLVSLLPGTVMDKETSLYLEQQLEDVLGFGISSTLQSIKLPFNKGIAESLPHLFDTPSSIRVAIDVVPEAGRSKHRSFFGWNMSTLSDHASSEQNKYWVSVPIRSMSNDAFSLTNLKQWFFKRKMLIINPTDGLFAVAEVLDDYSSVTKKYQLGISPSLSREALVWSPQNLGRVLVFFIPESSKTPLPGVYSLI
ncbi:MAG: hypothetical protein QG639_548 [Patescibacteria group bacterium]|jgi:hypothetical protein|nr:hypothetical protein [Patescibacteria group bacterium]